MGWSIGYDETWARDIGYGVPAVCDHPECNKEIDRGLAYVCSDQEPYGGDGCGLYFCEEHLNFGGKKGSSCCERCGQELDPFPAKPDLPMWTKFKMADPSWNKWRKANGHPEPSAMMVKEIQDWEDAL